MQSRKTSFKLHSYKAKYTEAIFLYIYFIFILLFTWFLRLELFSFSILYMLLPGLYFSLKQKQTVKNFLETLCFSIPFGLYVDYFARITKTWEAASFLDFKLFDVVTLEIQFWGIAYSFLGISCYKYFFDKSVSVKISLNYKKYLILLVLATLFFIIVVVGKLNPFFPYYYVQLNIIWTSILILGLLRYRYLFWRIVLFGLFLLPFHLMHEIVSLELNHWYFEIGNHILYLTFLDKYTFPIEELLWLIQVMPTIAVLHEYFVDDLS